MTQTCESSSAMASQACRSVLMPSRPSSSPAIWKPVTWSRPSSDEMRVLKKPVRTAYTERNASPVWNRASPRFTVLRVATSESRWDSCGWLSPTGRQSSRRLQLEQATLNASYFMVHDEPLVEHLLGERAGASALLWSRTGMVVFNMRNLKVFLIVARSLESRLRQINPPQHQFGTVPVHERPGHDNHSTRPHDFQRGADAP